MHNFVLSQKREHVSPFQGFGIEKLLYIFLESLKTRDCSEEQILHVPPPSFPPPPSTWSFSSSSSYHDLFSYTISLENKNEV